LVWKEHWYRFRDIAVGSWLKKGTFFYHLLNDEIIYVKQRQLN